MDIDISEWVKAARKHKGLTQEELALDLGFSSKGSISAIERKRNQPSIDILFKIAQICSYPLPYQNLYPVAIASDADSVLIPFCSGEQILSIIERNSMSREYEKSEETFSIPKSILINSKVDEKDALCTRMEGNSMSPVIPNSSLVILNTSSKNIIDGQLYGIVYGGLFRIRKVFNLPNNLLRLSAYNNIEYPDETVQKEEVHILGYAFSWIVTNN
ncbi:S24 family peptidase [Neisseria sp. Ec49-e6-T10]|uniref:S24 family peptidase n=1 Tax=Neisseria sp. Ec49-e6-T10 TaxID=3140744 RepID=UPI003EBFA6FE